MGKCSSWFGHKYQPRYDRGASTFKADVRGCSFEELAGVIDQYRTETYVRDVCVRCGATVERTYDNNDRELHP